MNIKSTIAIFIATLIHLSVISQFEYFNTVIGVTGDLDAELSPDLEVLGNGTYSIWGGGVDDGINYYYLRNLDSSAQEIQSGEFEFPGSTILLGAGGSYSFIEEFDIGFVTRTLYNTEGVYGLIIKVNAEMDTVWTKTYDLYGEFTDFFINTWDGSSIVIAGEYGLAPGERGTFIAKIDTTGEVLWNEPIHDPSEGSFRNTDISVFDQGYIVSGASGSGEDTEGQVEWIDPSGNLLATYSNNEPALLRGIMRHLTTLDSEIIVAQYIAYEDYSSSSASLLDYSRMNLSKLEVDGAGLVLIGTYFGDHEWVGGGAIKLIEGSDQGIAIMGNTYKVVDEELMFISFLLKLDEQYEMEWYTELAYEQCATCTNQLIDLEQAPDGGYVMVGRFDDYAVDPRYKTWLVKVDACGDLEWQGCAPVGTGEYTRPPTVTLFPNPATDMLHIALQSTVDISTMELLDSTGRTVLHSSFSHDLDISHLSAGVYLLRLLNEEAVVYSGVVSVE